MLIFSGKATVISEKQWDEAQEFETNHAGAKLPHVLAAH